jgi:hypothetical protein
MIPTPEKPSLLDIPLKRWLPQNTETLLALLLLLIGLVSRFQDLGARTMSHDEVNHVVPSFSLYSGNGYSYDPMSHGPLQFHAVLLLCLFGDNGSLPMPAAVLSIFTIAAPFSVPSIPGQGRGTLDFTVISPYCYFSGYAQIRPIAL